MDRPTSAARAFPLRQGHPVLLWSALPLWLLAFGVARLLEYSPFVSLWFPPTAVSFAALLVFGLRGLAPLLLAAFLGHLWTLDRLEMVWTPLAVIGGGLGFALAHALPFAALAELLRRAASRDPLGRFGPTTLLALILGGAVACLLTALGGSAVLLATGQAASIDLRWSVVPWWIGDYTGLLALGPLLVESARRRVFGADPVAEGVRRRGFGLRLTLLLLPIAAVLGLASLAPSDDALVFALVFSVVVQQWISHTHSPLQTLAALALAALAVALLTAVLGLGRHALMLQFTVLMLALTSYSALSFLSLRDENRRMARLLSTDALTAATSRSHFITVTEQRMADTRASGQPLSLLMLDLDHLKRINDSAGHGAGDEALRRFVAICHDHLRSGETLGRLGGDEFAMCLPGLGADAASARALALLSALAADSTESQPLSASIGVAQMRAGDTYSSLTQRADSALMQAKRDGRGRLALA